MASLSQIFTLGEASEFAEQLGLVPANYKNSDYERSITSLILIAAQIIAKTEDPSVDKATARRQRRYLKQICAQLAASVAVATETGADRRGPIADRISVGLFEKMAKRPAALTTGGGGGGGGGGPDLATLEGRLLATGNYDATQAAWLAAGAEDGFMAEFRIGEYWFEGTQYDTVMDIPGVFFERSVAALAQPVNTAYQSFGINIPRIVPGRGYYCNEARSNYCTYSHTVSNAGWSGGLLTKSSVGNSEPCGVNDAGLFTTVTANANKYLALPSTAFISGNTYCMSIMVKSGTIDRFQLIGNDTVFDGTHYANFYLSGEGEVTASSGVTSAFIRYVADGWYRLSIVKQASASSSATAMVLAVLSTGDETHFPAVSKDGTFYATGGQVEVGPYPTPPIITTSSYVTRPTEVLALPESMLPNPLPMTIYSELECSEKFGPAPRFWEWNNAALLFRNGQLPGNSTSLSISGSQTIDDLLDGPQRAAAVLNTGGGNSKFSINGTTTVAHANAFTRQNAYLIIANTSGSGNRAANDFMPFFCVRPVTSDTTTLEALSS